MSILSKLFGSKKPEREFKVVHDKYCDFTDTDDVSEYKGTVKWHNYDCDIVLDVDEYPSENPTIEKALAVFHMLYENMENWDRKVKECAAAEFMDENGMVEIWGDGKEDNVPPMPKEDFINNLDVFEIHIKENGELTFRIPADGLFTDHELVIETDISGENMTCSLCG
ncbi:DUF2262 domain-containing protein [uncultured Ruminococcus sp.]|uniref:DUF2262 domain-containing protein n=1 Tax=uncultured Ruminococcus sp. TaxID=165186 RepID=UPI001569CBAF|nr:DUF2262 domain-containing protein [uncultured Ruminococcus sp.]